MDDRILYTFYVYASNQTLIETPKSEWMKTFGEATKEKDGKMIILEEIPYDQGILRKFISYDRPHINLIFHRKKDPAWESSDGVKVWFQYGKIHNEYGPAIKNQCGCKIWVKEGKKHRMFGPSIIKGKECTGCFIFDHHRMWFPSYYLEDEPYIIMILLYTTYFILILMLVGFLINTYSSTV